jgi:hypothetical protein
MATLVPTGDETIGPARAGMDEERLRKILAKRKTTLG